MPARTVSRDPDGGAKISVPDLEANSAANVFQVGTTEEVQDASDQDEEDSGEGSGNQELESQTSRIENPYDDLDLGYTPSTVPRRCTDVSCLLIFIMYNALLLMIGRYGFMNGNPNNLWQLSNWRAEKCGEGEYKAEKYLFFCRSSDPTARGQLEMWYPICVASCPTSYWNITSCPRNLNLEHADSDWNMVVSTSSTRQPWVSVQVVDASNYRLPDYKQAPPTFGSIFTTSVAPWIPLVSIESPNSTHATGLARATDHVAQGLAPANILQQQQPDSQPAKRRLVVDSDIVLSDWRGNFTLVQEYAYPSFTFVGMVCLPWRADLQTQVHEWIKKTPLVSRWASLINSYQPLPVAIGTGIVLSYVYMTLLRFHANCLVWTGLTILTTGPLASGAYVLWCWKQGGCGVQIQDPGTYGLTGLVLLLTGVTFLFITCQLGQSVEETIGCIEWSCKAVLETPSLKMEPLIALCFRGIVYLLAGSIAVGVITSERVPAQVCRQEGHQPFLPPMDIVQYSMLAVVGFWFLWMNWVITAVSDFSIIYTTELWYFAGGLTRNSHAPPCAILRAWYMCFRYHLGTMVIAGLAIGFAQPSRIILGALTSASRMHQNALGYLLSCCCDCLVNFFENFLEPLSRSAYMDLALNARPFVESAYHASDVSNAEGDTQHILSGATWLFQLAGLGGITVLGNLQAFCIIHWYPGFMDPESEYYVQNPEFLQMCGAGLCFVVAFPFMILFSTVCDTILFCWTVDRQRTNQHSSSMFENACGLHPFLEELVSLGCACRSRPQPLSSAIAEPPQVFQEVDGKTHGNKC